MCTLSYVYTYIRKLHSYMLHHTIACGCIMELNYVRMYTAKLLPSVAQL